jgi:hypothetical protein
MTKKWGNSVKDSNRLDQFKLVYDYIKFHLALYLATPPVMIIIADSLSVKASPWFRGGLMLMIIVSIISGIHASLFMARFINRPWQENFLTEMEKHAFGGFRRFMDHVLYWVGIAIGLGSIGIAVTKEHVADQIITSLQTLLGL